MFYKIAKLYLIVSAAIMVSTVIAALFSYKSLQEFCICASNKLAYAWILLCITIVFCGISLLLYAKKGDNLLSPFSKNLLFYSALFQTACFITALIFVVLFAAKIINVI